MDTLKKIVVEYATNGGLFYSALTKVCKSKGRCKMYHEAAECYIAALEDCRAMIGLRKRGFISRTECAESLTEILGQTVDGFRLRITEILGAC